MNRRMQKSTILVIEDSPTQSISLQNVLENAGYRCMLASNGQTGLYLAQTVLPDVVVLDLEIPQLNGYQVCEQLKQDPKTAEIPIILMTHFSRNEWVERCLALGAVKYIPKDAFADVVLLETLRQMREGKEAA